ncbi:unnamed protein product [Peronospora belbahrii]|uniref:Cytosolic endo-beta-N-acetylglucosaminidase TIM barrel domain-containing protein n=1 Tax=Peronospora belbahrii TaxID=622444 RepID=A0AAU9L8A3_9STRA|nr:unnamed protein product [Peronospora belbahrii]
MNFMSIESLATLLCVTLGLFYWFYYDRIHSSNSTTHGNNHSDRRTSPSKRGIAAFVEYEILSNEIVLFVAHKKNLATFQSLFDALKVKFHIVDLARIAGGKQILDFLHEKYQNIEKEVQNEFLFVNRNFMGGLKQLRQLLLDGKKLTFGTQCDWSNIRIDNQSQTGFLILDTQHGFQNIRNITSKFRLMETTPLDTITDLQDFNPITMLQCSLPLAIQARNQPRRSKLLVCHDMKGGYQEDRYKQGCEDFHAYRFYQWDIIDTFVYFAHALVCPPPIGYITAGHCHGTRVLGTFLTEGEKGTKFCLELFQNAQTATVFAQKLATIASYGGFDGWLINLENDVPSQLVAFIHIFLHTLRKEMQLQNPFAQVVWYASLSTCGKCKSFVRLDDSSAEFFENVDAFYVNYGWNSDDAKFSAAFDLDRRYQVYMGIDVFGRHGTIGGGKMNCQEPLRLAWNARVSAALFAPGWTHECYQYEAKQDFIIVENRFWQAIRKSWKVKSPCYDALGGRNCLYSAFNIGRGIGIWTEGKRVGTSTWSNMTEMDIQPDQALHVGNVVTTTSGSMEAVISHNTSFQGGACVQFQGHLVGREKLYFKLYDVDIEFSSRRIMEISYTTAVREGSVCLLMLTVCPGLNRATHYVIMRSKKDFGPDAGDTRLDHKKALSSVAKATSEKHFYLPVSTEYFDLEGVDSEAVGGISIDGWCKKTYRLGGQLWDQKHIVEIGVLCTNKFGKASDEYEKYLAFIGEVCVVGNNSEAAVNAAQCGVHSQPKCCENARITSFRRNDTDSVAFEVQWDFALDGVPVRYVLVFARVQDNRRDFVGKSFDNALQVDKCLWHQSPLSSSRLIIELQSVSWTGQSSTSICFLHLEE